MVRRLARARLPWLALLGRAGTQQVGPALNIDVEFLLELVEPRQADVAPGSYVVVPDVNGDGRRLRGSGFGGHIKPFVLLIIVLAVAASAFKFTSKTANDDMCRVRTILGVSSIKIAQCFGTNASCPN